MKHKWVVEKGQSKSTVKLSKAFDQEVIQRMKKYQGESLLKKAAMNIFVEFLSPKEVFKLKKEFEKIDTDHSGFLEFEEIVQAVSDAGLNYSREEITKIIENLDFSGNKRVNYGEFIAASIDLQSYLTEERVIAIFKSFDVDNKNVISKENIRDAFSKFGRTVSKKDLDTIFEAHDENGDGQIDFEEFKRMMNFEKR